MTPGRITCAAISSHRTSGSMSPRMPLLGFRFPFVIAIAIAISIASGLYFVEGCLWPCAERLEVG
ncbi:hypothetical protein C8R44DRAFT_888131 [Mycena epipterygia]|nr:hypothetical protein C8R44DRAFT_888131 [Mycena epipterygia]